MCFVVNGSGCYINLVANLDVHCYVLLVAIMERYGVHCLVGRCLGTASNPFRYVFPNLGFLAVGTH